VIVEKLKYFSSSESKTNSHKDMAPKTMKPTINIDNNALARSRQGKNSRSERQRRRRPYGPSGYVILVAVSDDANETLNNSYAHPKAKTTKKWCASHRRAIARARNIKYNY
jgi:hypothetical protein